MRRLCVLLIGSFFWVIPSEAFGPLGDDDTWYQGSPSGPVPEPPDPQPVDGDGRSSEGGVGRIILRPFSFTQWPSLAELWAQQRRAEGQRLNTQGVQYYNNKQYALAEERFAAAWGKCPDGPSIRENLKNAAKARKQAQHQRLAGSLKFMPPISPYDVSVSGGTIHVPYSPAVLAPPDKMTSDIEDLITEKGKTYRKDAAGTHCNKFVNDYAQKRYHYNGFVDLVANGIVTKMRSGKDGWTLIRDPEKLNQPDLQTSFETARARAEEGYLVIVAVRRGGDTEGSGTGKSGHVAIIRPEPLQLQLKKHKWWEKDKQWRLPRIAHADSNGAEGNTTLSFGFRPKSKEELVIYYRKPPNR